MILARISAGIRTKEPGKRVKQGRAGQDTENTHVRKTQNKRTSQARQAAGDHASFDKRANGRPGHHRLDALGQPNGAKARTFRAATRPAHKSRPRKSTQRTRAIHRTRSLHRTRPLCYANSKRRASVIRHANALRRITTLVIQFNIGYSRSHPQCSAIPAVLGDTCVDVETNRPTRQSGQPIAPRRTIDRSASKKFAALATRP